MPTYPFPRAKAVGWALYEALTSAQMTQVDANAAQAADGLVWTDVAAFRNWTTPITVSQAGSALAYVPFNDSFWTIGVSGGLLLNAVQWGGGGGFGTGLGSAVGGISAVAARATAYDSTNNVLVIGVTPSSSSNVKYRRAVMTPSPAAFGSGTSSATNSFGVGCIEHVPALGLLVAGHLGNGVIETSTDGGSTWTNRTVPNANPRSCIAVGPINGSAGGIVVTSTTSTNKLIHSVDGINWIERTLPATKVWSNVVYVPLRGEFVAISDGLDAVAYSTDGITWTTRAFSLPPGVTSVSTGVEQKFLSAGRNIVGVVQVSLGNLFNIVVYSQDGGVTWRLAGTTFGTGNIGPLRSSGRQLLYSVLTNVQWSIATGF